MKKLIDDKPRFINTPPEKAKEEHIEELKVEKEIEKQEEIKEKIEEVIHPPKPFEWWFKRILFWGMILFILADKTIPVVRDIKYAVTNNANIQFTKNHPDMTQAMREYYEKLVKEDERDIIGAFGATPTPTPATVNLPTITPTETIRPTPRITP